MSVFYRDACPGVSILFVGGKVTLPIYTVGQVWLCRVNVICVGLLRFILIQHFFAQSSILLMVAWSFSEAIAGSSCVALYHRRR
jgi:uncharacterized membrane protein YuzA (DUF378 family)